MEIVMRLVLYFFIILVFALSLALVITSSKATQLVKHSDGTVTKEKNNPGLYGGSIVLVVSFGFLIVSIVGNSFFEYFSGFYFFIIGGMFLFVFIMLIIGLTKKNKEHFTPTGVCMKDGQMGYNDNGECMISAAVNSEDLEECERKRKECEAGKNESFKDGRGMKGEQLQGGDNLMGSGGMGNSDVGVPVYGICEYEEGGVVKFGYRHPRFGRRCVSNEMMERLVRENPDEGMMRRMSGVSYDFNPFQSTRCYGFSRGDLLKYDLKCKENFGNNFGLKNVENFGCPENDNRAVCEENYQMGIELPPNSTKCVPIGTDMNNVCQRKNLREKESKYIKMGYKEIKFSGCPEGTQRAICDGNYYDGKELFKNTTDPFPQTENPDRKCKEKCGLLSFSNKIITDNTAVGYIRAECKPN
jgi:hypothetical protein